MKSDDSSDERSELGGLAVAITEPEHEAGSPGAWRVKVAGELDLDSASRLNDTFDTLMGQGATLVIIDASSVQFMDSSGIRAIVQCGRRLHDVGGQLLIEGMSGAVQRVLEIAGLLEQYRA